MSLRAFRKYKCDPCDLDLETNCNKDRDRRAFNSNPPLCPACLKAMRFISRIEQNEIRENEGEFPGFPMPNSGQQT